MNAASFAAMSGGKLGMPPLLLDIVGMGPGRLRAALVGPKGVDEGVLEDIVGVAR